MLLINDAVDGGGDGEMYCAGGDVFKLRRREADETKREGEDSELHYCSLAVVQRGPQGLGVINFERWDGARRKTVTTRIVRDCLFSLVSQPRSH